MKDSGCCVTYMRKSTTRFKPHQPLQNTRQDRTAILGGMSPIFHSFSADGAPSAVFPPSCLAGFEHCWHYWTICSQNVFCPAIQGLGSTYRILNSTVLVALIAKRDFLHLCPVAKMPACCVHGAILHAGSVVQPSPPLPLGVLDIVLLPGPVSRRLLSRLLLQRLHVDPGGLHSAVAGCRGC